VLETGNLPSSPYVYQDLDATNHTQRYYILSTP
jgi:hypothetical protein